MKSFPRVKASLLLMVLLISMVLSFAPAAPAQAKLITYESVLQISYNAATVTNAMFPPDGAPVSIPINVSFRVEVPEKFISNILLRLIFLQTMIITSADIQLTVENAPEWAAVSITPSDVYVEISTETKYAQAILTIAPHAAAPSQEFNIKVKATSNEILNKHVASKTAYTEIHFKPGYIPLINVETDNPSRIVGPQETITFPIKITNLGNKQTLVTARVTNYPDGWSPLLPQSQVLIPSASEAGVGNNVATMTFSITPPYGAGWHNEQETITIEFTPQFSPPIAGENLTGSPIDFQVTVRNRGFSTPGFEIVGVLAALIIVVVLFKKGRKSV